MELTKEKFLKLVDIFYRWFWYYLSKKFKYKKVIDQKIDKRIINQNRRLYVLKNILRNLGILYGEKRPYSFGVIFNYFVGKVILNSNMLKSLSNEEFISLVFKYLLLINESLLLFFIKAPKNNKNGKREDSKVNLYGISRYIHIIRILFLREIKERNLDNIDNNIKLREILYKNLSNNMFSNYIKWLIDNYYIDGEKSLYTVVDKGFFRIIFNLTEHFDVYEYKKARYESNLRSLKNKRRQ